MCQEKLLRFNFNTETYTQQKDITIDPLCNAISIKNAGNMLVIFNGDILQPGESKVVGGNRKEVLYGRVDLSFQAPVPAPGVPTPLAFVTQKFYAPGQFDC